MSSLGSRRSEPESVIPEPPTLSGYVILQNIGSGVFGHVWLAWSIEQTFYCAIKASPYGEASELTRSMEDVMLEPLGLEAGAGCPFIIDMIFHVCDEQNQIIVLELARGGTVSKAIREVGVS